MAYAKIRPRRGTGYEWSVYNTVLAEGELGIQVPDTGIGTGLCKFKIGDGKTPWRELAYAFDGTAAAAIDGGGIEPTASIKIRSATSAEWSNNNPILGLKEIAYDSTMNSIKIGDGVTRWNALKFITTSEIIADDSGNSIYDFGYEAGVEDEDDNISYTPYDELIDYVSDNSGYTDNVIDQYGDDTTNTENNESENTTTADNNTEDNNSEEINNTPDNTEENIDTENNTDNENNNVEENTIDNMNDTDMNLDNNTVDDNTNEENIEDTSVDTGDNTDNTVVDDNTENNEEYNNTVENTEDNNIEEVDNTTTEDSNVDYNEDYNNTTDNTEYYNENNDTEDNNVEENY